MSAKDIIVNLSVTVEQLNSLIAHLEHHENQIAKEDYDFSIKELFVEVIGREPRCTDEY